MHQFIDPIDSVDSETLAHLFEQPLSDVAVIAIIASDIPTMTESQLASLLTEIFLAGSCAVGDALAPLARTELARRQRISRLEGASLAV